MERNIIVEKFTPIVRSVFKDNSIILSDSLSASDISLWTSATFMELLYETEKVFGVKFDFKEILRFQNIGSIIDSLQAHLNNA